MCIAVFVQKRVSETSDTQSKKNDIQNTWHINYLRKLLNEWPEVRLCVKCWARAPVSHLLSTWGFRPPNNRRAENKCEKDIGENILSRRLSSSLIILLINKKTISDTWSYIEYRRHWTGDGGGNIITSTSTPPVPYSRFVGKEIISERFFASNLPSSSWVTFISL